MMINKPPLKGSSLNSLYFGAIACVMTTLLFVSTAGLG